MCLGVPAKVLVEAESLGGLRYSLVDFGGVRRRVCTACVDVIPGDYVLVHAGIALTRIDAQEAERLLNLLQNWDENVEIAPEDSINEIP